MQRGFWHPRARICIENPAYADFVGLDFDGGNRLSVTAARTGPIFGFIPPGDRA
jgi:hypothetical protein